MAISLVAHTSAFGNFGANATSAGIDTTGASLLVVICADYAGEVIRTISDNKGNTWTPLSTYTNSPTRVRIHYAWNALTVGAGHTFSTVGSGTPFTSICILAFSGTKTSADPFDTENGATATAASLQTGSVTPSENDEVIITGLGIDGSTTDSIDLSFNFIEDEPYNSSHCEGSEAAYLIQTTASAVNPTWTGSSDERAAAIAVFKSDAGGGGGPTPRSSLPLLGIGQ